MGKKGVRKIYPELARSMIQNVTEYKAYLNWFEENISNSAPYKIDDNISQEN